MSQSAAAVIDLDSFRRARQKRAERAPLSRPAAAPIFMVPVLVAWIPVWPMVWPVARRHERVG